MVSPNILAELERARKDLEFRIFDPQNWLSVSERQESSAADPEAKGPLWVSRVNLPHPEEDDVRQALFRTIDTLSTENETYSKPAAAPVVGEWVGQRCNVDSGAPEPCISEEEKYSGLMRDVSSPITMLYVHGGAFYCGSPAQSRPLISKLTSLTGGRCFSLKYRLSPQHPFPAALLDLLLAYLSLLYPQSSPSSFHTPIPAHSIVLTGDSVGANLCLALIQTILTLSRHQSSSPPTIRWNGADRVLPLPAGLALISPWIDPTYSLPSHTTNRESDYIPPYNIAWHADFPHCAAWPSDPPREDIYCSASCLLHPLVNPAAAKDWRGAPPVLMLCGEEGPSDGAKVLAKQLDGQGARVRWVQFERMPHVFVSLLGRLEHSQLAVGEWARFCADVVRAPEGVVGEGLFVRVGDMRREVVPVQELTRLTREQALALMREVRARRRVVRRKIETKAKI